MKHAFNRGVLSSKMVVSLVGAGLLLAAGQAWALTPAGTNISNKATVTYKDANGNSYNALSNEAVVSVADVYTATLEQDRSKQGAPGDTVYFSHTLSNTGNASDTYTLTSYEGSGTSGTQGSYSIYVDANGNGLPDAGESATNSVTVAAGDQVNLILAVSVPSGAAASDPNITATLGAVSTNSGAVDDLTASKGLDGLDGTNTDTVDISSDAVLVATKSATLDAANQEITYTLTLKNNGGRAATNVDIVDAIPANTTFESVVSVNGLLGSNGDTFEDNTGASNSLPQTYSIASLANLDESTIGEDLNSDGDTGDTLPGLHLTDASLGVNTTVTVVYKVKIKPGLTAGTQIKNLFAAKGDLNGDNTPDSPVASNTVTNTVAQTYAVDADDTDGNDSDFDATDNDTFVVDSAASGAVVDFYGEVTNNGNGGDKLELHAANDGGAGYSGSDSAPTGNPTFPAGTTFSFWNAAGTVQLTDTNGDGNPDTGSLGSGGSLKIMVKADLPANASGSGPYAFTVTATSEGDSSVSDTTLDVLNTITAPHVDIANTYSSKLSDNGVADADAYVSGSPITTVAAAAGADASFNLFVANESGNPQSFNLGAAVPAGWTVKFYTVGVDINHDGTADNTSGVGTQITSTPSLPAGAIFMYTAKVTVSSDVAQARADHVDATAGGGAGDYPVEFNATSTSDSSVTDKKLDAVTVSANRNLSITPDGANQVQPGGSIDYPHTVSNDGNTVETVELGAADSASGWSNTTVVFAGSSCTATELSNLGTGTQTLCDTSNNGSSVTVADADADGLPEITLVPGQKFKVRVTVFAPSNAAQGAQDVLTLSATNTDSGAPSDASASATDTTKVILGQVRLSKEVGIDADCSCGASTPTWTPDSPFAQTQTNKVAPGQCVIWKLTASNEGAATAKTVVITDATTDFTDFVAAKDACKASDAGCTSPIAESGTQPTVEWQIGDLNAGDSATADFCVKVQ